MAQIDNSSAGVKKLRTSLNKSIDDFKKKKKKSDNLVEGIKSCWSDHQYDAFKKDYDKGTKEVFALLKKMKEFDKKLSKIQKKLEDYENIKIKRAFK